MRADQIRQGRQSARAFTLVEILIVISIIGVLVAMLLPALSKARDSAKTVLELNQLRQMTIGYASVAQDNSGRLPRRQQIHPLYGKIGGLESGGYSYRLLGLKGVKNTYTDRSNYIIQPADAARDYAFDAATKHPLNPRAVSWANTYANSTGNIYQDWGIVAGFKEDAGVNGTNDFAYAPPALYTKGLPGDVMIQGMATDFNVPSWGDYNQLYGWHPATAALATGPLPGYYEVTATATQLGPFLEGVNSAYYDGSASWTKGTNLVWKKYATFSTPYYGYYGLPPSSADW